MTNDNLESGLLYFWIIGNTSGLYVCFCGILCKLNRNLTLTHHFYEPEYHFGLNIQDFTLQDKIIIKDSLRILLNTGII